MAHPHPHPHYEALYIHVPFCSSKCDYCAFYSLANPGEELVRRYLDKLKQQLVSSEVSLTQLRTIYIGGGTPTSLRAWDLHSLCKAVKRVLQNSVPMEWTIECNPESLSSAKLEVLIDSGVNRVSLGIQSLLQQHRETIGRRGAIPRIGEIVSQLRRAGIARINADLIYGIPGQVAGDWRDDLIRVLDTGIGHISAYSLGIEDGTALHSRLHSDGCCSFTDETAVEMWNQTEAICATYGLIRYEVSNYARPHCECQHNQDIWHGATYLGCGPAACSFNGNQRWSQSADIERWLRGVSPEIDVLSASGRATEILAFGMRTTAGWDLAAFKERTGFDAISLRGEELEYLTEMGLLRMEAGRARPTERGLLFNDTVMESLI